MQSSVFCPHISKRCSCKNSNTEKRTYLWRTRERDRYPERQTANRAKSSKGYRARKTDPDGEREQQDSSRSAKHQSRAEMKELIQCGNEPDHRVQLHLCRLSLTCLNVTHTRKDPSVWWMSANSFYTIIINKYKNYRPGIDARNSITNNLHFSQIRCFSFHLIIAIRDYLLYRDKQLKHCSVSWFIKTQVSAIAEGDEHKSLQLECRKQVNGSLKASMWSTDCHASTVSQGKARLWMSKAPCNHHKNLWKFTQSKILIWSIQ